MTSGAQREKGLIRPRVQAAIDALSAGDRSARSAAICRAIVASEVFRSARSVLGYIATPAEVDVTALMGAALEAGKRVGAPRMDWESRTMWGVEVFEAQFQTEVRRHGVSEPLEGPPMAVEGIDLIIAPGVAFDLSGGRLGRGAGYYDRFLELWRGARDRADPEVSPEARGSVIGVCFGVQIVERVPRESHDALMDGVASEGGLMMCRDGTHRADRKR